MTILWPSSSPLPYILKFAFNSCILSSTRTKVCTPTPDKHPSFLERQFFYYSILRAWWTMSCHIRFITHVKFPHHQAFTCLEICSNLCLVHSLRALPCTPRSGLALLVSLWDAAVCKLNLLWSNYTSNIFLTQVPSSIKQGIADALVPKSGKDCKALRRLMMTRWPMVSPLCFLFIKCVIACTYLYGLLRKNLMLGRFGSPEYARQVLSLCCLETWYPQGDIIK